MLVFRILHRHINSITEGREISEPRMEGLEEGRRRQGGKGDAGVGGEREMGDRRSLIYSHGKGKTFAEMISGYFDTYHIPGDHRAEPGKKNADASLHRDLLVLRFFTRVDPTLLQNPLILVALGCKQVIQGAKLITATYNSR